MIDFFNKTLLKEGKKMKKQNISIYDLSKATGFSTATVSKALNHTGRISEKTRNTILLKATELNYIPNFHAQALSAKKSWIIGIIFADNLWAGFSHPYFSVILEHFKRTVEEQGYEVVFINRNSGQRQLSYLEFCKNRKLDGVFIVNYYSDSKQIPELIHSGIPTVISDYGDLDVPSIVSDDYSGGVMATNYLVSLNHKKIYHVAGPLETFAAQKRRDGFLSVVKESSIDYKVINAYHYAVDNGYQVTKELIQNKDIPTAFFAGSDWLALGIIKALKEENIDVPNDVSVIGFDDLYFIEYTSPSLTTIAQNKKQIGVESAKTLIDKIHGNEVKSKVIDVSIVKRDSCRKI